MLIHLKRVSIQGGTVLCTCRDITERKQAEKELATTRLELAHAARLALVGEMTASIVHEIQQPLTAIQANASAGLHVARNGSNARGAVDELCDIFTDIHAASADAAAIVRAPPDAGAQAAARAARPRRERRRERRAPARGRGRAAAAGVTHPRGAGPLAAAHPTPTACRCSTSC